MSTQFYIPFNNYTVYLIYESIIYFIFIYFVQTLVTFLCDYVYAPEW